jgi:STE24 endopeptidase
VFSLCVLALTAAVRLPIAFWAGYLHEHEWALSTQSLGGWSLDRLKGLALTLFFGTSALSGLVAAARLWPAAWPMIVATAAAFVVLTLSFIAPVLLEPIFSRFTPLTDRELAGSLQRLAARAGVPVRRILVADASRRTNKLNAYVSGLGRTRRLVLFDTLLAEANRKEVQLVVAHELGHRRSRHVAKATLLGMLGAAVFVAALWALFCGCRLFARRSGSREPATRGSCPSSSCSVRSSASPPLRLVRGSRGTGSDRPMPSHSSSRTTLRPSSPPIAGSRSRTSPTSPRRGSSILRFSHPTVPDRIAAARARQPQAVRVSASVKEPVPDATPPRPL